MLTADQLTPTTFTTAPLMADPCCFAKCKVDKEHEGYLITHFNNVASAVYEVAFVEDWQKAEKIRELFNQQNNGWNYGKPSTAETAVAFLLSSAKQAGTWVMASVPTLEPAKELYHDDPLGQREHKRFEARLVWVPDVPGKNPIYPADVISF